MAKFIRKNAQALVVLSCFVIVGCGDKQGLGLESHAKVLEASAQLSCRFGSKYSEETKKCEKLEFFENKNALAPREVSAQFVPIPQITRDSWVIKRVVAKPGDGCISLTKDTPLPLDETGCEKVAKQYDKKFIALMHLGKVMQKEVLIKVGEEWFLYQDEKGVLEWKAPRG